LPPNMWPSTAKCWERNSAIAKKVLLGGIVAAGLAMRLAYMLHGHPFVDEFTSILAAQAILQHGLPILPSGLFYEHGLLFSYLITPWVGLAAGLRSIVGSN
jgi:hypothetical protein